MSPMTRDYDHIYNREIMLDWIKLGDDEDNPFMRFMAYWLVFNMIYEPYRIETDQNGNTVFDEHGKRKWRKEFDAIWACFKDNGERFGLYDPLANGDADEFKETKLLRSGDKRADKKHVDTADAEIYALIWTVYKVRCNFFHGEKKLHDAEDRRLVTSAAAIVRGYLSTVGFPLKANCN